MHSPLPSAIRTLTRARDAQALSVDPINHHVLELLNLALEANADLGLARLKLSAANGQASAVPVTKRKGKEAQVPAGRAGPVQDVEMSIG